ncbi:hypothetical protein WKH33_11700 [Priestia sp. WB3]|uniref:hypothetical protein n=1 Tax=Bacillus pumilus TaxID=1408 RepID=UPI001C2431B0|nr:hypothetical protein [Bacillus pumilus]MBU8576634.1 hypothetical protein [Bacillus pumilus]
MNVIRFLKENSSLQVIKIIENIDNCEIIIQIKKGLPADNFSFLSDVFSLINVRDKVSIDFKIDNLLESTMRAVEDIGNLISEIGIAIEMDAESDLSLIVNIIKESVDNSVTIYDFDAFQDYLVDMNLKAVLVKFNQLIKREKRLKFEVQHEGIEGGTSSFYFSSTKNFPNEPSIERERVISIRNRVSNFVGNVALDLIPQDFKMIDANDSLGSLEKMFNNLNNIFSFAFLSNKVVMFSEDNNIIDFEFLGHRDLNFTVDYKNLNFDNDVLTSIYQWVYEGLHPYDKLGLARNTITKECIIKDDGRFILHKDCFNSLKSSYQLFQKENIEEYIRVKNTLSDLLISLTQQTSQIVSGLASSLKSNQLLIVTFFTSIVILNAISEKKIEKIFTKDITIISYAILIISFFFLLSSKWYAWMERSRYKVQYNRLKKMYSDILSDTDINEIFDSDSAYNEDLLFLKKKIWLFTITWLLEILIIFAAVFYLKICS